MVCPIRLSLLRATKKLLAIADYYCNTVCTYSPRSGTNLVTGQTSDAIQFEEQPFAITDVVGKGMYNPIDYGIEVQWKDTGCYRGYVCKYKIVNSSIRLDEVELGLNDSDAASTLKGEGPLVFGKAPIRDVHEGELINAHKEKRGPSIWLSSYHRYGNIDTEMPFTGGLLVGAEFIQELHLNTGMQAPHKYSQVFELIFDSGRLLLSKDHSEKMNGFREELSNRELVTFPWKHSALKANFDFEFDYPRVGISRDGPG